MSDRYGASSSGANHELSAVHRGLIALVERLGMQMDDCTTAAQVDAVATRIQDVTARVTAVGAVLLVARTPEITRLANAVSGTFPEIDRAVADRERAQSAVASITNMLHIVDETVRVARLIC